VHILGQRDDIPDLLSALDVFAHPSLRAEGISQSTLQAMAMGLPVVTTPVGATEEAVIEGRTGRLVAPGDVQGLAACIGALLDDPGARSRLGEAARLHVENSFSIGAMLDKTEACYRALLSGTKAR
jgi:glycosyltransferase involved in cell wall biosynthesis